MKRITRNFNSKDYELISKLVCLCEPSNTFIFDGLTVKGDVVHVVKEYVSENPSKKFRIWLIDKGYTDNNK